MRAFAVVALLAFGCGRAPEEAKLPRSEVPPIAPAKAGAPGAITSWAELRARGDFESVVISGRCGLTGRGEADWLELPGTNTFARVSPQMGVTLSDGTKVLCTFAEIPRDEFPKWAAKYPPGTVVTLRGVYMGPNPLILSTCTVVE